MALTSDGPCHAVAVVGGACAGSTVAELLAESGCQVVVFDQNERPYGKIEDGLPRWHAAQRRAEYAKIDARLARPGIRYVPCTKLGRDLDFLELCQGWGWSAVVLANGAWTDRPLVAGGAEEALDHGLVYQNPFVYWFNHKHETGYDGPVYQVQDGAVVVGGGLASIDVIKIIQLELYLRALKERGIEVDMHELELRGIPKTLAKHGIEDPASLGIEGALLIYRRRVEDMPLATPPPNASDKVKAKIQQVRQKILAKCQRNFLFRVETQLVTKELLVEDGELTGIVVQRTEVEGRKATPVEGSERTIPTRQVISSIGSIPEPLPGVERKGAYYRFRDWDTGEYEPLPGVFAAGNVVTGQGNIKASLEHGRFVAGNLIENYLCVSEEDAGRDLSGAFRAADARGTAAAGAVTERLKLKPPLAVETVNQILARVAARQQEVGYGGDYQAWIEAHTPPEGL